MRKTRLLAREKAAMMLKPVAIAFFFCATLTVAADAAFACTCVPTPTVLENFEDSDVVLIGRVISVDKVNTEEKKYYPDGIRSATVIVEKVYKGNVQVREELVFGQGTGANCTWSFDEKRIGQQILFHVDTPKPDTKWRASTCTRTSEVKDAKEDLLYLDNLKTLNGKTRVSGDYRVWPNKGFSVANKTIRIVGQNKTYETKTDDDGAYEIYDLPPGNYLLEPEMPKDWRLHWFSRLRNVAGSSALHNSTKSVAFTLEPKKHVSIDLTFQPDNAVEGRIVDSSGNPVEGVGVHLWPSNRSEQSGDYDHTDANGEFRIEAVDEGSYVLVMNPDGANSQNKYLRLFYPGVTQRKKATLINVSAGEVIRNITLVIKRLETVTLSGIVKYSDGTPMEDARVSFTPVKTEGFAEDERSHVNSLGQFELKVIKGLRGEISAFIYASVGDYENCPKLDELIKASGESYATIETPSLKIDAAQDLNNLVLRFPFAGCKWKQREPH